MGNLKNIFTVFLEMLKVKHTKAFSDQYFNEHPHRNNLYGLSKMLSDYGVDHAATRFADKADNISQIETPFIARFSGNFVAVHKVDAGNVAFVWNGADHLLPIEKFVEAWTGIALLAGTSEKSIEPDYRKHKIAERITLLKKIALFSASGCFAVIGYLSGNGILPLEIDLVVRSFYTVAGISALLLVNIVGLYISYLLLQKQMHVQSRYADKICSLFKQKDCNSVLESEVAKLFGVIGWSEIGFGYFLTNILLLLFSPALVPSIALLNILTLPYLFWSVWYQKVKAKQWCVLCLIVQACLWAIFAINLLWGYIPLAVIAESASVIAGSYSVIADLIRNLIITGSCYAVFILATNLLVPKLNTDRTIQYLKQSINSMKANEGVFAVLLKQQPYHEMNDCHSVIHFGNPDSKLQVTALSNPYCNPCAKMHKRIEELLKKVNNGISVQYILSSFGEDLKSTNKYLIAACLNSPFNHPCPSEGGESMQILSDWFEKGKAMKDDF